MMHDPVAIRVPMPGWIGERISTAAQARIIGQDFRTRGPT